MEIVPLRGRGVRHETLLRLRQIKWYNYKTEAIASARKEIAA